MTLKTRTLAVWAFLASLAALLFRALFHAEAARADREAARADNAEGSLGVLINVQTGREKTAHAQEGRRHDEDARLDAGHRDHFDNDW